MCGPIFSIPLGIYLGLGLLGHMVTPCFTFWRIPKLFSSVATLFYIPNEVLVSLYPPHILLWSYCLILAILVHIQWKLIVVLIFISLMISDMEHLFTCLLAIYILSLEKCLLTFKLDYLGTLPPPYFLSCKSAFYTLDTRSIYHYHIYDLKIFYFILWIIFFTLLIVSFAQKFFIKSDLSIFPLIACVSGVRSKKPLSDLKSCRFTLFFF